MLNFFRTNREEAGTVNQHCTMESETIQKKERKLKNRKRINIKTVLMAILVFAISICSYGQELRPVKGINKKWGFVDRTGKEVIPFMYEAVQEFSEGLAAVRLNKKWGFVDETGKEVIPFKYEAVQNFSEGLAAVRINYRWGFIDTIGKEVIPFTFWAIGDFSEGLAAARYFYGGSGFIDKAGKEVILFEFQWVGDFSEGLAAVQRNNKWGAIDKNGTMVVPCIYGNMHNAVIAGKKEKKAQEEEKAAALERERIALEREKAEKEAQEKERIALEQEKAEALERERIALEREKIALEREKLVQKVQSSEREEIPQKQIIPQQGVNTTISSTYDVITLRNGEQIKAKVLEISETETKYKRHDNLDGPTRSVSLATVFSIDYANGTREVISTVAKSGTNKTQTTTNPFQGAALGLNLLTGFTFKNDNSDIGIGAKLSYTFPVPIRLAGELDVLFGGSSIVSTRWMGYDLYLQYLFSGKGKRFATYPLVGLGGINQNVKVDFLGVTENSSFNRFAVTLGWGMEGLSKNGKFFYGAETRVKIVKLDIDSGKIGYRMHIAAGIGYKF